MPIEVHVVEQNDYDNWLKDAEQEFANNNYFPNNIKLAKLINK